jgi:hypothetical protein
MGRTERVIVALLVVTAAAAFALIPRLLSAPGGLPGGGFGPSLGPSQNRSVVQALVIAGPPRGASVSHATQLPTRVAAAPVGPVVRAATKPSFAAQRRSARRSFLRLRPVQSSARPRILRPRRRLAPPHRLRRRRRLLLLRRRRPSSSSSSSSSLLLPPPPPLPPTSPQPGRGYGDKNHTHRPSLHVPLRRRHPRLPRRRRHHHLRLPSRPNPLTRERGSRTRTQRRRARVPQRVARRPTAARPLCRWLEHLDRVTSACAAISEHFVRHRT